MLLFSNLRLLPLALAGLLLGVIANVTPASAQSCSFGVSAPTFGAVDLLAGAPIDTFGSVTINCTGAANQTVKVCANFGAGTGGAAADGAARYLLQGSNVLKYNYYRDASHSTVWGSSLGGMGAAQPPGISVALGAGGSAVVNTPIYARLFGAQGGAIAGTYTSTISADFRYVYDTGLGCQAIASNPSTVPLAVSANYAASCLISASNLDFGTITALAAAVDGQSALTLTCSNGSGYSVALDGGVAAASDPRYRHMLNASNVLIYGLFRDGARQLPWGANVGTILGGTGTGTSQPVPVYGRIPPQTIPPPGLYQDTIVATVTY